MIGGAVSEGLKPTHLPPPLLPCGELEASIEKKKKKKEMVDGVGRVLLTASAYLGGGQKSAIHTRQAGDAV